MKRREDRRWRLWPRALSLQSMRGRMALMLAIAMLPAGAVAMQVGLNAISARDAAYQEALGRRALQSISHERAVIDEISELLGVLAASPALQQIEAGDCREWMGGVIERYSYLASLAVVGENGELRCSVPARPAGYRTPASPVRRIAASRGALAMGFVERGSLSGESVLGAVEPIHSEGEQRIGYVGASISLSRLSDILTASRTLSGGRAAIIDAQGRVLAQSEWRSAEPAPGLPSPEQVRQLIGPDPAFVRVSGGDAVIAPLHAPDIYIAVSWAPEQPAWRRWSEIALTVAAPVLIWLLAIAAGWIAIEIYITRPLSDLERAARSYARGEDADPAAFQTAPDEIRSLRRTLAAMAKTLLGREARLVEALAEERALLREVHHRVKNNLQMVASLLNIQARASRDESEAWALARAHDRVQLLALVHQRIYASGEVRQLRIDELAADIARQLIQSRGALAREINLVMHLDEALADVDRAVPMTFLIGEGVSMALDALADAGPVELRLYVHEDADGEVRFAIDSDIESERAGAPGPGARLINAFARQLGAVAGRNLERPFMLWVSASPPTSAA